MYNRQDSYSTISKIEESEEQSFSEPSSNHDYKIEETKNSIQNSNLQSKFLTLENDDEPYLDSDLEAYDQPRMSISKIPSCIENTQKSDFLKS